MSYTERTDVERQLLNAHNLDPNSVSNSVGVAENIQAFCGLGALDAYVEGSKPASSNISASIEDAVDWESDSW